MWIVSMCMCVWGGGEREIVRGPLFNCGAWLKELTMYKNNRVGIACSKN